MECNVRKLREAVNLATQTLPLKQETVCLKGLYYWTEDDNVSINLPLAETSSYISTNVIEIDRTKFDAVRIISNADGAIWISVADIVRGRAQKITYNVTRGENVINLATTKIGGNTLDYWMEYRGGSKVARIGLSTSVSASTTPYMDNEAFEQLEIQLS